MTDGELILSLCREKGFRIEAFNEDELILKFRESYGDHGSLIAMRHKETRKRLDALGGFFDQRRFLKQIIRQKGGTARNDIKRG